MRAGVRARRGFDDEQAAGLDDERAAAQVAADHARRPAGAASRSRGRRGDGEQRAFGILDLVAELRYALASAALVGGFAAGWYSLTHER